jgi:hypothetical protein
MKKNSFARPWEPAPELPPTEIASLILKHGINEIGVIMIPQDNGGLRCVIPHPLELEEAQQILRGEPC